VGWGGGGLGGGGGVVGGGGGCVGCFWVLVGVVGGWLGGPGGVVWSAKKKGTLTAQEDFLPPRRTLFLSQGPKLGKANLAHPFSWERSVPPTKPSREGGPKKVERRKEGFANFSRSSMKRRQERETLKKKRESERRKKHLSGGEKENSQSTRRGWRKYSVGGARK